MTRFALAFICLGLGSAAAGDDSDPLDRIEEQLTFSSPEAVVRARLSGTLDLEEYAFDQPAPGLVSADTNFLFNPRLNLFLDAQVGQKLYVFAQTRLDRGFDPSSENLRARLDEYIVRLTPWSTGAMSLQTGKFATVVGNWVRRHASWDNSFITAPLPYENVTGIFDIAAASTPGLLLKWANLGPGPFPREEYLAQLRVPVIWGPSYATGAAVSGVLGLADYALEIKNASLSSRPAVWEPGATDWAHPTWSGRIGFRPDPAWNFGFSASSGAYLLPRAGPTLAGGTSLGDYREVVLGQDIGYAWHHLQLWSEVFRTRFSIPRVGTAETWAYYVEARFKFTSRLFGAVRWNQQFFGTIPDGAGGTTQWGRDTWRIDFAPTYRFTSHVQLKLQYSLQHHPLGRAAGRRLIATQLVIRF